MTPKEKAKELCNKFLRSYKVTLFPPFRKARDESKQCALIAIDEILSTYNELDPKLTYWQKVKQEIELL